MEVIQNLENILELPERINGLEVRYSPYRLSIEGENIPIYIETCRIFQEVYIHIISAHYCLLMANDIEHPKIYKDEGGYKWFRELNTNTSIMWYNAAFDILLQTLWIYKELYKKHNFGKKEKPIYHDRINSDFLPQILEGCTMGRVGKYLNNELITKKLKNFREEHFKIHGFGNSLKHRNSVKYKDVYPISNQEYSVDYFYEEDGKIQINKDGYNSSNTLKLENLNVVIGLLKDYHIDFMRLIDDVYDFLNFKELFVK